MRKLESCDAVRLEEPCNSGHEVVKIRNLSKDIVGDYEIGALAFGYQLIRESSSEKLRARWNALADGDRGDVDGGLDAKYRHAKREKVLQQVAVITGQLNNQASGAQPEPLRDGFAECLCVSHPRRRIGGKIGILPEDLLGRHVLFELN